MKYSLTKYWKEAIEKQKEHLINYRYLQYFTNYKA